jgi:hypothetical protein
MCQKKPQKESSLRSSQQMTSGTSAEDIAIYRRISQGVLLFHAAGILPEMVPCTMDIRKKIGRVEKRRPMQ